MLGAYKLSKAPKPHNEARKPATSLTSFPRGNSPNMVNYHPLGIFGCQSEIGTETEKNVYFFQGGGSAKKSLVKTNMKSSFFGSFYFLNIGIRGGKACYKKTVSFIR